MSGHGWSALTRRVGERPRQPPRLRVGLVRRGITRLEVAILLVVVVVLAGVVITYLGRQRGLADEKVCANNLRRIGEAILGFHEEKKFLPAARIAPGYATWAVQIVPHL